MGNDKMRAIMRVVVAAYLFYLSYQITQSGIVSGEAKGAQRVLLIAAVIGFIAAACYFLYSAYKMLRQMSEDSAKARNELSAERAQEAKDEIRQIEAKEEEDADAGSLPEEVTDAVAATDAVEEAASDEAAESAKAVGTVQAPVSEETSND